MKKWVTTVLLIFFIATFVVSAYFLVDYLLDARKEQGAFDELAALVDKAQTSAPQQGDQAGSASQDGPDGEFDPHRGLVPVVDPGTGETIYILAEYAELYTLNSDIAGWMYIPDTDINYPVMYRPEDTDYYLHRDFYGEYSARGCFYVQEACNLDPHSDNVTVYGHNMSDGSMMADLHKYKKQSFWEDHKTITFNTLTEYRQYEVLAVFRTSVSVDTGFLYNLFVDAMEPEEFDAYVAKCKSIAYYDTGVSAEYGDKLITLSTCDRSITNGRMVVVAKLITDSDAENIQFEQQ